MEVKNIPAAIIWCGIKNTILKDFNILQGYRESLPNTIVAANDGHIAPKIID